MKKRSYARLFTAAAVLVGSLLGVSKPVSAEDGRVAHIAHTDIGIYFRTDPNNWESRGALAGVDGDEVTLRCVIEGMAVGQFENHIWYKADNAKGSGLLPDHFLDTPVKANEYLAGMPRCDDNGSQPQADIQQAKTLFYSPNPRPWGLPIEAFTDLDLPYADWTSDNCSSQRAVPSNLPSTLDTLSGWSVARLGPVYFLASASESQKAQIHRIVLFDPGSEANMSGCDQQYDINGLLANWLKSDGQNQLVIFAGHDTEMKSFAGLWKHYLAGIWKQPFADRATICDYNMMEHTAVLRNFANQARAWSGSCPSGESLTIWHP